MQEPKQGLKSGHAIMINQFGRVELNHTEFGLKPLKTTSETMRVHTVDDCDVLRITRKSKWLSNWIQGLVDTVCYQNMSTTKTLRSCLFHGQVTPKIFYLIVFQVSKVFDVFCSIKKILLKVGFIKEMRTT